jgi:hypothetical protein
MTDIAIGVYALRTFREAEGYDYGWVHDDDVNLPRPQLTSVALTGLHWTGGVCKATCVGMSTHTAPAESCSCGIYGTQTLEHLRKQWPRETKEIVAVIAAEGDTIIGQKGMRTARARVVAYRCIDLRAETAQRQFIGAKRYHDTQDMLDAYGLEKGENPFKALGRVLQGVKRR